ncbi:GNAT family N-acetyltransferase [Bifidobacterium sp. ESL0800]|uniref:GNAT family N-acetyltransferase n=1 Tax=Bifidobacterium sp. ESL0800 TaxID=2983236 RepID=UPI0023FA2B61|nr:GNAT family N-acetyltransferase [Bifidobacterium sp. ESL0800]WEV75574.1 GNAT family N-acetyltransferase [Bifidobacterium sp. ESL0800]
MSENSEIPAEDATPRQLPERIVIPEIRGEMVHLRPATLDDLPRLDQLEVYFNASGDTGKDKQSERAVVQAWVKRSVAWVNGVAASESGVGDPEARRTMAWTILTDSDHDADGKIDAEETDNVIGMIFLIDIDGWARSARIQVMLGKDYRGRGYSRDAMPRVMTYGFASTPVGLGMHRIWVAVPEKSTRTLSVYQSLGFIKSGTSRDSLWDASIGKYQDLIVLDTLVDEYDPIHSLDAFGMHVIEGNPGVKEAMAAREHSIEIQQHKNRKNKDVVSSPDASCGETSGNLAEQGNGGEGNGQKAKRKHDDAGVVESQSVANEASAAVDSISGAADMATARGDDSLSASARQSSEYPEQKRKSDDSDETSWPFSATQSKKSKKAWWRSLGHGSQKKGDVDKTSVSKNDKSGGSVQ